MPYLRDVPASANYRLSIFGSLRKLANSKTTQINLRHPLSEDQTSSPTQRLPINLRHLTLYSPILLSHRMMNPLIPSCQNLTPSF